MREENPMKSTVLMLSEIFNTTAKSCKNEKEIKLASDVLDVLGCYDLKAEEKKCKSLGKNSLLLTLSKEIKDNLEKHGYDRTAKNEQQAVAQSKVHFDTIKISYSFWKISLKTPGMDPIEEASRTVNTMKKFFRHGI